MGVLQTGGGHTQRDSRLRGFSRPSPSERELLSLSKSWSFGVEAQNGAANGIRSDASCIRHCETGRLAAP